MSNASPSEKQEIFKMLKNLCFTFCFGWILLSSVKSHGITAPSAAEIVFRWTSLDFIWQNEGDRDASISNRTFIVNNNIITGIKVYRNRVFVTVPRWKRGIPSTLNEVLKNKNGEYALKPFPSWSMQTVGDCGALQYVQSMEIDPNTGHMWIIDVGRLNIFEPAYVQAACKAKIVEIDIATEKIINVYEFPDSVAAMASNFLNDIVLHYIDGEARFAYITDTGDAKLIVYDKQKNDSYFFQHSSMKPEAGYSIVTINGSSRNMTTPIDGIAMSPDFKFVYYCPLASFRLYQIPTSVLQSKGDFASGVKLIGQKQSQSDGLVFSQRAIYYGGLSTNAVYKLSYERIKASRSYQKIPYEQTIAQNKTTLQWVDTFAIDETGHLWLVANRLLYFFENTMNFNADSAPNMYIWKIDIGEHGYLWNANVRTLANGGHSTVPYFGVVTNLLAYLIFLLTVL